MNKRDHAREGVRRRAAELGIVIEALPSGLLHVRGKFVDFKVRDLADVLPHDLEPSRW
ncbi:hypothetical protein [Stutzerimonas nitrititolerans]|uniref:hypothetical protein n=1 Tax=Stutzerimonas nitrititolerans TaxID=2482751 RepID=UPI0028AA36EB|nr:hypothetical protein [Stutzerimonas nitrititolerans]